VLAEIDVGRVVAGKYELVRLIGKGAMGEVWLATHNSLGGEFAIKLVKPSDDEEDESAAGRFQLEAQISAKLSRRTRHIVSVSDHGEEGGLAYLVMELLEGESLEGRIKRTGEMTLEETVAIVMQVARALGQAHAEGIFHRDLKPANVFLTKDEDGRTLVKLLDFGIARSAKPFRTRSPVMTGKDMVLGTPSYMSPEQARGLDSLDHRCDIWALAVVAYESLTRHIPWEGESVEDIFLSICTHRAQPVLGRRPDLPPAIHDVFARSFAPKLDARYATAIELSDALEALVDPLAVEAAMGAVPRAGTSSARRLPAASDHDIAGAMAMAQPRELATDPHGTAVASPTEFMRRTKRSSGWLLAAVAALITIGVILLGLRSFTSRDVAATIPSPPPSTAPTNTVPPPSDPPPPPTAPVETAVTPSPKAPVRPSPPTRGPAPPPVHVSPPVPVAPAVTAAPPPHPPHVAPHASPAATPAKPPPNPPDKSGVF
jgi:eukaryotic-like serine/threonine-protein kinase